MRYEVMLLEIGRNEGEEYNTRADACDTLINVGTTEVYKEEAKNILLKLGLISFFFLNPFVNKIIFFLVNKGFRLKRILQIIQ
ncbi:hypothetical protein EBT16_12580 [bacterium]|nr:hypothetical protein [bacterium]